MKQNTKDWIHYASAIAFLTSAIVLAFTNFWLEHYIHNSVLVYVGEAISFVGAVYGIALVARHEIDKRVNEIAKRFEDKNNGNIADT